MINLNSFIEVTEYKTGDKILFNTFHVINVRENVINVVMGNSIKTFKVRESYDEIKEKVNWK